jgi:dipeptidyl aminopeptidase/acylaminoacyl peptidase
MVFVHGGPIRQMRDGWHPADTYAFFYGVQQVLAHRGVVGLLVNYRGGIGYGREHNRGLYRGMGHNELGDVIAGARALGALPYVDPGRIGIWGISYGGYLVLHAMAQFPGVFAMGVNIAGNYARLDAIGWKDRTYPGYADYKLTCLGNEAERRRASPQTHRQGITGPMLHLHGTEDEAVAFEQLHRIIADSVALGLEFDAQAYPGESHFFRRPETWRDALRRIDGYIHRYLQVPPARPGEEEGEV